MKIILSFLFTVVMSVPVLAQDSTIVVVLSNDDSVPIGAQFYEGDRIKSTEGMELTLPDGSDVELEKNTEVRVTIMRPHLSAPVTKIQLLRGSLRAQVVPRRNQTFQVTTPVAVAGVRGTDFSVEYTVPASATSTGDNGEISDVDVYDGTVDVTQSSTSTTEAVATGSGATVGRRKLLRRSVSEERREQWENRREAIIEALKRRWKIEKDEDLAAKIKEKLKHLSPERREAIQNRFKTNLQKHREQIEKRHNRREVRRDNFQEKRETVRENTRERRETRRENRR